MISKWAQAVEIKNLAGLYTDLNQPKSGASCFQQCATSFFQNFNTYFFQVLWLLRAGIADYRAPGLMPIFNILMMDFLVMTNVQVVDGLIFSWLSVKVWPAEGGAATGEKTSWSRQQTRPHRPL